MSLYQGTYARLYDLFYADKPYDDEVEYVDGILRSAADGPSESLLDVACGTGQHAVRFAARGWNVLGVDRSEDMLRMARERADGKGVEFVTSDMRELDLPRSSFDAAVCLFDSIGYGLTNEAVQATLQGIHRHLRPGGLFVVEFWQASAMISAFEPVRVREWQADFGRVVRISQTEIDVATSIASVDYRVLVLGSDGRFESSNERHQNRFFLVQEMDQLLRSTGFEPLGFTAGFDADAPVVRETWHVVALAHARTARAQ